MTFIRRAKSSRARRPAGPRKRRAALGFAGLVTAIVLGMENFVVLTGVTEGPVTYLL